MNKNTLNVKVGKIEIETNKIPRKARLIPAKEIEARKSWAEISIRINNINTGMKRRG